MRRDKTKTYALAAAITLAVVLAGTLINWARDHAKLRSELEKTIEAEHSHSLADSVVALERQHTRDASIAQMQTALGQKTAEATQLASELKIANQKLTGDQNDYAFLQSQFDDLKPRYDRAASDGARNYTLYTKWKELGLSQREYIKGLYVDDLTLRKAAKQDPYTPFSFSDPEASATLTDSGGQIPGSPVKN